MTRDTVNAVVTFTDPDATPEPMSSVYSVSTHGYVSPDAPNRHAPARLASAVTVEKRIGFLFWQERSGAEFGNIDINIQDGGKDTIDGEVVDWVEWAKENLTPQVVISVELSDGTLRHVATADAVEVSFPNDRTIRVSLQVKHGRKLKQFINDYVPETSNYDQEVQGLPIPTLLGAGQASPPGYDYATFEPRTHVKTLQVDPQNLTYMVTFLDGDLVPVSAGAYYVMDRGAVLRENESPGFTLVENGFQLTSNPSGEITFTWMSEEGGGVLDPVDLTSGELLQGHFRICRWAVWRAGIDVNEFFPDELDFPDLQPTNIEDDQNPQLSYVGEVTAEQVLDDCVSTDVGAWFINEFGDFVFLKMEPPEDQTLDTTYDDSDMIGDISAFTDRAPGLSTRLNYSYSPGAIDINNLAGSITDEARRERLSREWLEMSTEASVIGAYDTAFGHPPMKFRAPGLFTNRVRDELNRRWLDYYLGIRRFYTITVSIRNDKGIPELGDVIGIQSERSTMFQYGVLPLLVKRVRYNLGDGTVQIEGWGGETADPPPLPPAPVLEGSEFDETTAQLDWTIPTA
jgi:hypothetical protein